MSTFYRVTMTDGRTCRKSAQSAGEAIQYALHKYRGVMVQSCYSGMTEEDVEAERKMDGTSKAMPGVINYDIPPHSAIPADSEEVEA